MSCTRDRTVSDSMTECMKHRASLPPESIGALRIGFEEVRRNIEEAAQEDEYEAFIERCDFCYFLSIWKDYYLERIFFNRKIVC